MSLDWDTRRIKDREVHFPPDERGLMNDDLHVLIWLTMPTGIGQVTEKNVEEFARRVDIWQKVIGSGFTLTERNPDDPEDVTATPYVVPMEKVLKAVGLGTNASHKTRAQFNKDLWEAHERTVRTEV